MYVYNLHEYVYILDSNNWIINLYITTTRGWSLYTVIIFEEPPVFNDHPLLYIITLYYYFIAKVQRQASYMLSL